jgi:nitrous oxide reductase accessory protein NosL
MKRLVRSLFPMLAIVIFCSLSASAEMVPCAQCGMGADLSAKFTSKIVQLKQTLHFCDIGDLFAYLKANPAAAAEAQVKDYSSGSWLNAQQAFYVQSAKKFQTPMGWGIAAFKNKAETVEFGNAMDFNTMTKSLK